MAGKLGLDTFDLAIVALFLAAILGLGFSARLRNASVLQYLVAGRALSIPAFVATLVCTWYGGILGIGESVGFFGLGTWLLFGVPYYAFGVIYALFLSARVRSAPQISLPERLADRWGRSAGILSAVLLFLLAVPAAHVLMLGVLVELLTGWDRLPAVIVATAVGTAFLYRGGLLADVRVSILAFLMMYIGFAAMLVWCLIHYPLVETWGRLPAASLSLSGGAGPIAVLSFFILGAWTLVDPGFHQRAVAAESPTSARKGLLVSVGCWFVFDLLSIGTAMYAMALLDPAPESALHIFPAFGAQILPSGLRAIFLCGMVGTILTAMVGYTLVAGASFGREIVSRIAGETRDGAVKSWTRLGLALSSVVAVALARYLDSVVALWYQWGGIVTGSLLIPVVLAYRSKPGRTSATAVSVSMALAFAVSCAWLVYGRANGNIYLEVSIGGESVGLGTLAPALAISATVIGLARLGDKKRNG